MPIKVEYTVDDEKEKTAIIKDRSPLPIHYPLLPFTLIRSKYTGSDGKQQYEYWVKCLKFGLDIDKEIELVSKAWSNDDDYNDFIPNGMECHYSGECNHGSLETFTGPYGVGNLGHYPKRPDGRPRKIVFDSGMSKLVDIFEERTDDNYYNSDCNCWTYIGSSEDEEKGNFSLYGYLYGYEVPFVYDYHTNELKWDIAGEGKDYETYLRFEMVVAKEKLSTKEELIRFLTGHGAMFSSLKPIHDTGIYYGGWYQNKLNFDWDGVKLLRDVVFFGYKIAEVKNCEIVSNNASYARNYHFVIGNDKRTNENKYVNIVSEGTEIDGKPLKFDTIKRI